MERISIISLIYQSVEYAEFLYDNIRRHTPELETGEAEFFFVANDATPEVLDFLWKKNYPHCININPKYSDEERFNMGFAYPEYMGRVYRGYNFGMLMAHNPIIVLVSSDNCFSPNWLSNLRKRLTPWNIVSPKLLQPIVPFINPLNLSQSPVAEYGHTLKTFYEYAFLEEVSRISEDSISVGNAFMPLMIYKYNAMFIGYYPEGNLHDGEYDRIKAFGDMEFYRKLSDIGVEHITSNDSIVYHFNEGERLLKINDY